MLAGLTSIAAAVQEMATLIDGLGRDPGDGAQGRKEPSTRCSVTCRHFRGRKARSVGLADRVRGRISDGASRRCRR
jgi:hypothetical protein